MRRRPFNLENYYYEANVPAFFQQQNMSSASNSIEDKLSSCQAIDEFQDPNTPRWSWRLSVSLSVITLKHPAILCQTALVSFFPIGSELPPLEKILSRLSDYGVSSANCSCAVEPMKVQTLILLFPLALFIFPFLELTRSLDSRSPATTTL